MLISLRIRTQDVLIETDIETNLFYSRTMLGKGIDNSPEILNCNKCFKVLRFLRITNLPFIYLEKHILSYLHFLSIQ